MFFNYIKVTIRSFLKQKYYSLINILGLALGIAACLLILLFVQDELSFEHGFENHDQVYRLVQDFPMGNHLSRSATVPFPNRNALLTDFPSIRDAALIYRPSAWGNTPIIKFDEDEYYEDDFVFAEPDLFNIYHIVFLKGNREKALMGPNELILTESSAEKYFGDEDPIGKRVNLNGFRDLEVTAVIEDLPHNTHLQFTMIASFETFKSFFNNPAFFDNQWVWVAAWLYFTVEDENDLERIRASIPDYIDRHYPENLADQGVVLHIQKADRIHLTSSLELEFKPNGKIQHVYLFSSVAALILIIAIINFMNLATARSTKRAREVGLRKVMGAYRKMLIMQFLGEAFVTTFISLMVALFMVYLSLPFFNQLTGKVLDIGVLANSMFLTGIIVIFLFTGFVSGSYPALVLSSFDPNIVLKGQPLSNSRGGLFRKILVITQFVVSITLMICIGIVIRQMNFIHKKDMGFDKETILMADMNFNFFNEYGSFKNTLEGNPEIVAVSMLGGSIPGEEIPIENAFIPTGDPIETQQWFSALFARHDFEKVTDVSFIDGHSFKIGSSVDSAGFIINESAAQALGWPLDDVIGRSLDRMVGTGPDNIQTGTVIGLVKDYHYRPLYEPIKPLVIMMGGQQLCIKLHTDDLPAALKMINGVWDEHFTDTPFRFSFMDQNLDKLYAREDKFSSTIQYFSGMAIFIACLGLLGLSSHTTESRRKEIGIRKVNGATLSSLLGLLTLEFSKLILVAFAISVPLAYFFGNLWLSAFAYRVDIGILTHIIAGILALLIALVTISYHTVKAALDNPVQALRYE